KKQGGSKKCHGGDHYLKANAPEHRERRIGTQHLDEEASQRVTSHVEHEQPTATQPAGAVDVNQQADDEEVPHHLVEEGGLDGGDDIRGGPRRGGCQVAGFIDAAV